MKKQISIDEIEEMIKGKLKQNGVLEIISQEKISEIKNKIKDILEKGKKGNDLEEATEVAPSNEVPAVSPAPVQTSNPNITVTTTQDPQKTEVIEKEKELELKEKELIKKEIELEEKQKELKKKEEELSYKHEFPEVLKSIKPEEVIIFDKNELSLGMENLSNRKFRLKSDPDNKKSANELWLLSAITKTDVYLVELKKIGELIFDPYQGNTSFESVTDIEEISKQNNDIEQNHNVDMALKSQIPDQEMLDSVEPVKDVSQPIMNSSDLDKEKFETSFKDTITKIVSDELNKISSQTTKKNIFSL